MSKEKATQDLFKEIVLDCINDEVRWRGNLKNLISEKVKEVTSQSPFTENIKGYVERRANKLITSAKIKEVLEEEIKSLIVFKMHHFLAAKGQDLADLYSLNVIKEQIIKELRKEYELHSKK